MTFLNLDVGQLESWIAVITGLLGLAGILFNKKVREVLASPFVKFGKLLSQSEVNSKLDDIMKELKPNSGSTLRDAVQRLEARQGMLTSKFIAMLDQPTNPPTFEGDADGSMTWVSASFLTMTGRTFDEIKGYGWNNAVHPDDLEDVRHEWGLAIQQKRAFEFTFRFRHVSGDTIRVSVRAVPTVVQGDVVGYMGFVNILGSRKKVQTNTLLNNGVV